MRNWRNGTFQLSIFLAATLLSGAKPKENPLDRMVPIPANEPIPVVDFFRPRMFTRPKLNPAGTHFAAIFSAGKDRNDLVTMELSTAKVNRITGGDDYDIADFDWFGDDRILFSIVRDKMYATGLFAAFLDPKKSAYPIQRHNVVIPIGSPRTKPDELILWIKNSAKDHGADGGVCRIDVAKNLLTSSGFNGQDDGLRAAVLRYYPMPKPGNVASYLSDINGELAYAVTSKDGIATLHRLVDNKWIPSPINLDEIDLVAAGDQPGELIVLGPKRDNKPRALHRMNAETGELGALIAENEKYDLKNIRVFRDPVDGHSLGIQYSHLQPDEIWLNPKYKNLQESLAVTFPDHVVTILGSDKKQNRFFVRVASDINPGTYYLIQTETQPIGLMKVADMAPWIESARMQPMRKLVYKTRDGKKIESLVTLPAGATKESPVPLVVLPHGGPWVNDSWGWDPEAQFLASRGYAVFQPNYRGSTGTAWQFPEEDQWAFRKMHDDVTDGVKQLLKTGLIDPDRIAIMGSSFGGYLAICGAAYEPDLYRCAVTICGVFDWERVIKASRYSEYHRSSYGVLRRHLGDPEKQKDLFETLSPLKKIGQIKGSVFVAHGVEDVVANVAESRKLISELKKHKIPYEKQIERDEGHGFQKLENEVELYTSIEAFLKRNLSPRPKT
ncbi:MAG: alpha/beta fold hydrolase [Nibricoccus sp.]